MAGPTTADGWTTVTRATRPRRRPRSRSQRMPYNATGLGRTKLGKNPHNADSIAQTASHDAERLRSCPWWGCAAGSLPQTRVSALVCLGLGSFLSSANARAQLAAAIRLRVDCLQEDAPCFMADPAMAAEDEDICGRAGFDVVAGFDEALARTSRAREGGTLLLFMPHCERVLYEHVLSVLWGTCLEETHIFGNCFSAFYGAGEGAVEGWSYMDAVIAEKVAIESACGDASLSIWHNAFNDLAVTRFDGFRGEVGGEGGFWSWRPESDVLQRIAMKPCPTEEVD